MAWTQADLDALENAIAKGVLVVGHGSKRVQYRSLDEMKQIRSMMISALETTQAKCSHFAAHKRGY